MVAYKRLVASFYVWLLDKNIWKELEKKIKLACAGKRYFIGGYWEWALRLKGF